MGKMIKWQNENSLTTWLPLTTYVSILSLYVFHSTAQVAPCWPCPPHGPPHGLGVCSNTSPLGRAFSHLRSLSVEPSVLRCGTLVTLVAGFKPQKMDGIPPSHLVMVMFYRDQMTINQWIFRDTLKLNRLCVQVAWLQGRSQTSHPSFFLSQWSFCLRGFSGCQLEKRLGGNHELHTAFWESVQHPSNTSSN